MELIEEQYNFYIWLLGEIEKAEILVDNYKKYKEDYLKANKNNFFLKKYETAIIRLPILNEIINECRQTPWEEVEQQAAFEYEISDSPGDVYNDPWK